MAADPKACRERALECMEQARIARSPELKQLLQDLAQSWMMLAVELERAEGRSDDDAGIKTGE